MNRKMYWGMAALILLLGAFVFMMVRNQAEIRELKRQLADAKELEKHMTQQPAADNKPPRPAKEGFKWVWHGDHWDEMPIAQSDAPQQIPIVVDEVPKTEPVQVKPITGINDLQEYLTFFESFGDDPSLEELHESNYNEKAIEYGTAMRGFDYKNAPELEKEMAKQINEKVYSLNSIWAAKFDVEWQKLRTEPELPEDFRTTIAMPDDNERGDE